jgi:hypothetical protein
MFDIRRSRRSAPSRCVPNSTLASRQHFVADPVIWHTRFVVRRGGTVGAPTHSGQLPSRRSS